jgi:quercetin dioxygenase-like cupin family protein
MSLPVEDFEGLEVRILLPGEGDTYESAAGDRADFKVTAPASAGHYTLFEYFSKPGHPGIPLHVHESHEELWYVLEGVLTLRVGDEVHRAVPGSTYLVPRGVPHAFWTEGDESSRFIGVFSPGGFEEWFAERNRLVAEGRANHQTMSELALKFDMRILEDVPPTMTGGTPGGS